MKALMQELRENAVKSITGADSIEALEALRVKSFGSTGITRPPRLGRFFSNSASTILKRL